MKQFGFKTTLCYSGVGGESNKAWDQETMFSQLAKRSARQRFEEKAGKFSALISPVSATQVQC